jgi:ATP-dependent Lon protease
MNQADTLTLRPLQFDFSAANFHVHVPEGAIPKDGPSAGLAISVSILSVLLQQAPPPRWAMTGELTLTGKVLPIGGLKEKLLAAIREGVEQVILPEDNKQEWDEFDSEIHGKLTPHFVKSAGEAYELLFTR